MKQLRVEQEAMLFYAECTKIMKMWANVYKSLQFRHIERMLLLKEFICDSMLFLNYHEFSFWKCTATLEADIAEVRSLLYNKTSLFQNWQLSRHYYLHARHMLEYRENKNQLHASPDA
jgi:hypothetical protein